MVQVKFLEAIYQKYVMLQFRNGASKVMQIYNIFL